MPIPASCLSHPTVKWRWIPGPSLALTSLVALCVSVGASLASAGTTTCAKPADAVAAFHATFTHGTMSLGSAEVAGLSAKACGAVTGKTGSAVLTVQPGDIKFPAVSVKLLFINLPSTITVNAPLSGPFKPGPGFTSAKVRLTTNLSASVRVLGFSCVIGPLSPILTTDESGTLHGAIFTGSQKKGFTGKLVANDFAVPIIQRSETCPWLIAKLANALAGLPAAPGKASLSMEGSIKTP